MNNLLFSCNSESGSVFNGKVKNWSMMVGINLITIHVYTRICKTFLFRPTLAFETLTKAFCILYDSISGYEYKIRK